MGAQGIELSETVRRMEESIPQVIVLLEAAVERCINLTGGSEADELILALDETILQYISSLQETLKSLRSICGVDNIIQSDPKRDSGLLKKEAARIVDMVSEEEEWSIVQGALQILTVADCLTSRSSVFEASLRATLCRLSITLSLSVRGSNLDRFHASTNDGNIEDTLVGKEALDIASLRLIDASEKSRKLFNLLEQVMSSIKHIHSLKLTHLLHLIFLLRYNLLAFVHRPIHLIKNYLVRERLLIILQSTVKRSTIPCASSYIPKSGSIC